MRQVKEIVNPDWLTLIVVPDLHNHVVNRSRSQLTNISQFMTNPDNLTGMFGYHAIIKVPKWATGWSSNVWEVYS